MRCWRRRQIDPCCRFHVTQRDGLEPVAEHCEAAAKSGSVKSLEADFLHSAFKGQQDAVDLVMALVRVSQCWAGLGA